MLTQTASKLACIVSSLPVSDCAVTNNTCFCADEGYAAVVENCVLSNCTIRETLGMHPARGKPRGQERRTKAHSYAVITNFTAANCGFQEANQDFTFVLINILIFGVGSIFFWLRILSRVVGVAQWGWDDTTIAIAYVGHWSSPGPQKVFQR